jgi:hypothetical protein
MRRMVSALTREACETMDLTPEEAQAAKGQGGMTRLRNTLKQAVTQVGAASIPEVEDPRVSFFKGWFFRHAPETQASVSRRSIRDLRC